MSITAEFRTPAVERQRLGECSEAEILACLGRIVASDEFAGSAQLIRFLRYVVESCLRGEAGRLKESSIGVEVFNRGGGYDPKTDPIVRVEARRLRTKLTAYYETAGVAERVRISLPKGGYTAAFEKADEDAPEPKPESQRWGWQPALVVAGALGIMMLGLAGVYYRVTADERLVSGFWQSLLEGETPVLIVPADSGLVMYQDLTHRAVSLSEYVSGEYRTRTGTEIASLATRRYTSMADLSFAMRLAGKPEAMKRGVQTRYARDLRMEELKNANVILLGARHSNPWVELFEKGATLQLAHDEVSRVFRVQNLAPQEGEAGEITVSPEELKSDIYGIVTFHRNREGAGHTLLVAGTSVAGTEAAASLLLDPVRFLPWLKKATHDGNLRGFDMLVHDRNLAGSASQAEVVAFHVD